MEHENILRIPFISSGGEIEATLLYGVAVRTMNLFCMKRNEEAIKDGSRIFSVYTLRDGTRIYVITETDRSATMILLPEDW